MIHAGLTAHAQARSDATVERVTRAIAALRQRGERPSIRAICRVANQLEPDRPILCESVICRNERAHALYTAANPAVKRRARRLTRRDPRLERMTKAGLIEEIHRLRARLGHTEAKLRKLVFPDLPPDSAAR